MQRLSCMLILFSLTLCTACRSREAPPHQSDPPQTPALSGNRHEETEAEKGPLVVFLGDSLTAGFGITEEEAFPARLAEYFRAVERPVRVVNAGVSGDTSAGGLRRLPWLLKQRPDVVVVGLGGNDGLRGLPVEHTRENLRGIVEQVLEARSQVLLLGIQMPPNYGEDYARDFAAIFPHLAEELQVPLVPFLLEGVGGRPELNLADGIHPTAEGHERLTRNVQPYLEAILEALESAPAR